MKIGIIGGAGYTGGELLRILLHHPNAEIAFVHSNSQAGKPVWATHTDLVGDTDLTFTDQSDSGEAEVLFLCSGHGESEKFLNENPLSEGQKLIDLSTDFRDESEGFVYGLPELQRETIRTAQRIANPGCFATSIELALLPLAGAGLLKNSVHVSAITGSTGAGQALAATNHFSWRSNNVSIYKAFTHQHLAEIGMSLRKNQPDFTHRVHFIPYRGAFTRGILANVYTDFAGSLADAKELYFKYYESHPFTHLSEAPVDVKQVVGTNKCLLHLEIHDGQLLVSSVIDNLTKGASGQAVQNMNLIFGLEETVGLQLRAIGF
ncbi:MAG: N-acetyl-gamma-glutamyl-phosphate reductase [Cytophagaceae bacterium]|nr:N-acetyl-gamma-glutamyl-phosphate reductase [Cytophagaceae bacterium]